MEEKIKPGVEYLLDNKIVIKVIKPLNRSNTTFMVETSSGSILTVETWRLSTHKKISR